MGKTSNDSKTASEHKTNELPRSRAARCQKLKMSETICHSALDAESRVFIFWIPASAGMTIFDPAAELRGIL
jgi:hypothetical protein